MPEGNVVLRAAHAARLERGGNNAIVATVPQGNARPPGTAKEREAYPGASRERKPPQQYAPPVAVQRRPRALAVAAGRARRGGMIAGGGRAADPLSDGQDASSDMHDYDNIVRILVNEAGNEVVGYAVWWRDAAGRQVALCAGPGMGLPLILSAPTAQARDDGRASREC